jgi:hypothetical protein
MILILQAMYIHVSHYYGYSTSFLCCCCWQLAA